MEIVKKKYWLETYGCQMNKAESDALEIQLKNNGWQPAKNHENASLVILNTCSVRKTAENRIWGRIGFYKNLKLKKNIKLAVTGCMSERLKDELTELNPVDIVIGNFNKKYFLEAVENSFNNIGKTSFIEENEYEFDHFHSNGNNFKSFVPIMHGCNNFCSYCIVPYVRGHEVSRSPYEIIEEIERLEDYNVKEITLLGQNVNSYRYNLNNKMIDFPELLLFILKKIKAIKWIRFLTSHPKDLSDKLIDVIQGDNKICRHIHLPVQHGSDKILYLMKRKYKRKDYISLINSIKNRISDISITTDILIGFPGETESDYNDTINLMKEIRFNDAFTYKYNPREGTEAYNFDDDVPEELKLKRLSEIIELQREISSEIKQEKIGSIVPVLAESVSKKNHQELLGRTEKDEMAVFPGNPDIIGSMADIELVSLAGNTFIGKEIKERICLGK